MALYGQGDWVIGYQNRQIFLNRKLIKERDVDADEMRNRAASFLIQMTGVQDVYTSQRLLLSNGTDRVAAMRNGYYPKLSGDLVLDLCPGWEVVYEDANDTREYVRVNAVPAPCFILAHDVKPVPYHLSGACDGHRSYRFSPFADSFAEWFGRCSAFRNTILIHSFLRS